MHRNSGAEVATAISVAYGHMLRLDIQHGYLQAVGIDRKLGSELLMTHGSDQCS